MGLGKFLMLFRAEESPENEIGIALCDLLICATNSIRSPPCLFEKYVRISSVMPCPVSSIPTKYPAECHHSVNQWLITDADQHRSVFAGRCTGGACQGSCHLR